MPAESPVPPERALDAVSGKVVLILGASRGIGAATARLFASRGARVVVASRHLDALVRLAESIRSEGGDAWPIQVDQSDPAAMSSLGASVASQMGRLDAAFNNAGEGLPPTPLADVPVEAFDRVLRATVTGTFLAMQQEIPLLLRSGGGSIVNMASTAGLSAFRGGGPYVAAKHAIIGLTKAAAIDYGDRGVRVNVVAPGPIDTERLQAAPEEYRERARSAVPLRRLGQPEEVGELVLWLSSDRARFVTGATIPVDGGRLAGVA
ncbi:MAG TPA: SDR family NAD(P)-dependent oxidoreductase [Thermoplasmata archaeon]|nr:SDR family NAD(P)-dependent oxidoreductase [Thermoplasmata archaeon]